jgi:hypothetical protein
MTTWTADPPGARWDGGAAHLSHDAAVSDPRRLADLDLPLDLVQAAMRAGDRQARRTTRFDPPMMEGLLRWAATTTALRELLEPSGWTWDDPRNLSRTIHPGGEFAVVVTTGDDGVGLPERDPGTRHVKGSATEWAILGHQLPLPGPVELASEQLTLFDSAELSSPGGPARTWFLLFHVLPGTIRMELSLPRSFEDGRLTRWQERILLPEIDRAP